MPKTKRPTWEIELESALYAYRDFETGIPAAEARLQELYDRRDNGRRIIATYELQESQHMQARVQFEEEITAQIVDTEARINKMIEHRRLIEQIVKDKFGHEEDGRSRQFIEVYYWMNLPKHKAGRAIREIQHIAKPTMYERRDFILRILRRPMGL